MPGGIQAAAVSRAAWSSAIQAIKALASIGGDGVALDMPGGVRDVVTAPAMIRGGLRHSRSFNEILQLDANEQTQRRGQAEQDGSEVKSVGLESTWRVVVLPVFRLKHGPLPPFPLHALGGALELLAGELRENSHPCHRPHRADDVDLLKL
jgi:hypothetical protein